MNPIQYPEKLPTTLQEFFNNAWRHAVVEKRPASVSKYGACRYRSDDGNCCLIGRSIPEQVYETAMESWRAKDVFSRLKLSRQLEYQEVHQEADAINDLQRCHDSVAEQPDYSVAVEVKLRNFSAHYGLAIPEAA